MVRVVRSLSVILSVMFFLSLAFSHRGAVAAPAPRLGVRSGTVPLPVSGSRAFINYRHVGEVGCRDATEAEAHALKLRLGHPLHEISGEGRGRQQALEVQSAGLQIILRATNQLENYPLAKAAFLAAAERWQAVISTPITVIIDVDFGPTWFGDEYDEDVLGQTDSQTLGDSNIYSDVRAALLGGLSLSDSRALVYNQLPASSVPTDLGATSHVQAPSAVWRALGFISPVADPTSEESDLGSPPAIGFNSAFPFDFDPSNGIDANKTDFDAVAVHEIGHALGFDSNTGFRELSSRAPIAVSMWDIFRFRPGASAETFATAPRILSSGGEQTFFDGTLTLGLSTGRPDGTGGDREQASHWKDDRLTGAQIGVMDPTIADGVRMAISDNDLAALRVMGFSVGTSSAAADAPVITNVAFNGVKKLKIVGKGFGGQMEVEINGRVISPPATVTLSTAKKLILKAPQVDLNLQGGTNQIHVIRDGVRSSPFTITL